jgi:hypothetical protein
MVTDTILDAARMRGDALADDAVAAVFALGDTPAVARLAATLMRDDYAVAVRSLDGSGPALELIQQSGPVEKRTADSIARGERVFAEHGPEMMMLLCCYSLPSSYAASKGVQVLHRTAYLAKRPNRRLFETAQFVVDVLSPGGLGPGGKGLQTALKVRLMHAAIRHLILLDRANPWDTGELGVPINQEDLLGTLMTFTWLILDGLHRLGAQLTPPQQQSYFDAWLAVGGLMGIEPQLLPQTVAEAQATTALIERRQVAASDAGREMTAALLGMMETSLPAPFKSMPGCLIREFLPPHVATFLGIPAQPLREEALRLVDDALQPLQRVVDLEARTHAVVRAFNIHLLRWMLGVELDGQPARFAIPSSLQEEWQLAPPDSEESFWEKLHQRITALRSS